MPSLATAEGPFYHWVLTVKSCNIAFKAIFLIFYGEQSKTQDSEHHAPQVHLPVNTVLSALLRFCLSELDFNVRLEELQESSNHIISPPNL